MGRESSGIISLTFADLERSDKGHLPKIMVSVRDSTIVTIDHCWKHVANRKLLILILDISLRSRLFEYQSRCPVLLAKFESCFLL